MGITCSNCNFISNDSLDLYYKHENPIKELTPHIDNKEKSYFFLKIIV
jgi:hypothetical protein